MKYVRTKDNKFIELHSRQEFEKTHPEFINNDTFNYDKWFNLVTQDIDILKQADTIEELCDDYVVWQDGYDTPISNKIAYDFKSMKTVIQLGMVAGINCWLKLGIWTDKGLIYVAKLNDKGEFELI